MPFLVIGVHIIKYATLAFPIWYKFYIILASFKYATFLKF